MTDKILEIKIIIQRVFGIKLKVFGITFYDRIFLRNNRENNASFERLTAFNSSKIISRDNKFNVCRYLLNFI